MGRVKSRQEAAHKRAQREDNIRKAIKAIKTMKKDGKPYMTIRDASTTFGIPFSTLCGRLKGAKPHFLAYQAQ
ncbi:hypothetical protein L211DRAFT_83948 [Terfezia boudieri ATCC MYA-4762]|uniref:HTH psq-type domain-containing protein n=1 Tax=Terfezia boudieri ATCC MYA-4762 TaxID=1051890 RepID=A0A3N4LV64_9PEZI|nr:hypothetical protein L211DRAFT_83948 [Terfezia boudieri ATCC MYA-4762]